MPVNLTPFQRAMVALDAALTGRPIRDCEHTVSQQCDSPEAWYIKGEHYLSDGGYSRLWLNEEKIFLTSNSTEKVKSRWDAAQREADVVRVFIRAFFNEHGLIWGEEPVAR